MDVQDLAGYLISDDSGGHDYKLIVKDIIDAETLECRLEPINAVGNVIDFTIVNNTVHLEDSLNKDTVGIDDNSDKFKEVGRLLFSLINVWMLNHPELTTSDKHTLVRELLTQNNINTFFNNYHKFTSVKR